MVGPIVEKIILGADAAGLDAGLAKSAVSINNFVKKVAAAGIAIATFHYAEKAFSDITKSITETAENIDKLGKTAQSIGVPIEELSKLKYAAELSGSSLEGISIGIGKLAKNMSEMGDDAARAFRLLGVGVKDSDGSLRSITSVISDVAGKFSNMEDGAGKTALAMTLFGKSGKDLIPLLNSGADGLKKMYDEAAKFGLVISGDTFRAAEAFNDNLTRLSKIKEGLTITITAQLLPALQMFTGMLVSAAANSDRLATVGEKVKTGLEATTVSVLYTVTALKGLGDALTAINNLGEALGSGDLKKIAGAWDWLTLIIEKGIKDIREVPQVAADLIKSSQNIGDSALTLADKMQAPALSSEKFRKALDDIRIKTMELRGELSYLPPGFAQQAISLDLITAKSILAGQAINKMASGDLKMLSDAMWKFRAEQITDENLLPWEKLQKQITEINMAFANSDMSVQTYQRALQRAAESAGASWGQFGINIAGTFKSLGDAFGKSSRQMFNIGKAGAIAQAIINTYQGSTKALAEIPFPFNFAASAAIIAKGFADVAQIRAQQFPSAAMGGSFTVPGGLSGVDNRLVQMHLAAGEQVDITPANKAGGYDQRVIDVRGLGRERYERAEVVQLIGAINDALSDGYRIKLS